MEIIKKAFRYYKCETITIVNKTNFNPNNVGNLLLNWLCKKIKNSHNWYCYLRHNDALLKNVKANSK